MFWFGTRPLRQIAQFHLTMDAPQNQQPLGGGTNGTFWVCSCQLVLLPPMVFLDMALKKIWKEDTYFTSRSMDVYIAKLRKHLKVDANIEIMNRNKDISARCGFAYNIYLHI